MRVLLTGCAGFIGSHLTQRLLERGDTVVGVDDFNDYYDPSIKERNLRDALENLRFSVIRTDILDPDLPRQVGEDHFDKVVHLAARAGVRPSLTQTLLYQKVNVEGTLRMLELADARGCKEMVIASSSSVYGNNKKVPFHEDDPVFHPISPYAATKASAELISHTYAHLRGMAVTNLRFFTVYGPRQRPEMAIHKFVRRMLEGRSFEMYGDGSTSRDYTFIDDIITGTIGAIDNPNGYRVYNIGNHNTVTLKRLIETIGEALGVEPKIVVKPTQPGDVERTWADISRASEELGYEPTTSIEDGVAKFVAWYRRVVQR